MSTERDNLTLSLLPGERQKLAEAANAGGHRSVAAYIRHCLGLPLIPRGRPWPVKPAEAPESQQPSE